MIARLTGAVCILLMTGCATTAGTTSDTRHYQTSLDDALGAVSAALEEMRMEVESASPPGHYPYVVVATFATDGVQRGYISSTSRKQTLTITLRQPDRGGVEVQVQAGSSSNYMSAAPNEARTRFLTHLDRRLGR